MDNVYVFSIPWQEIVDWYLAQPVYGQILILIGIFALLALAVVIVYYILKGVAYLVYYVLKGVYYLLKVIGLLFYKLFEALYYAISGKPKPNKKQDTVQQIPTQVILVNKDEEPIVPIQKPVQIVQPDVSYCSECGNKFSDSMLESLSERGFAFCIHCGNKKTQEYQIGIEGQ
ncbi:MAG: hypothetical protein ACFFHD_10560 [Promethearchaeota archaeon]